MYVSDDAVRAWRSQSGSSYVLACKRSFQSFYDHDAVDSASYLDELIENITDPSMPEGTRQLGRTLRRWRTQLISWHESRVSNAPTECINNTIKRVKRIAYGFTTSRNYRIRSLLDAGKPNWKLLPTISTPKYATNALTPTSKQSPLEIMSW